MMMEKDSVKARKTILISGAGIAGPVCAYWLHQYGYEVVIAERARTLRDGGQNVDIKGAGQQVIRMMGLVERIEARNTLEQGQKYVDATGKLVAVFPKGAFATLTNDFEILRGDFAQILFEATVEICDYRFGTFVTSLEEKNDSMSVTFNDGSVEDFEFVICAEGIGSATRDMILPSETSFRYLAAYMSFFKISRRPGDDGWAYTVNGVDGTFITLRPGNETETTVLVTFIRKKHDITWENQGEAKGMLHDALKGRGTVADRISAELETVRDFYFGPMSQVRVSRWSSGRFVLLGDAAYCPTAFTGEGTALALVGAYVLAGEIKRSTHYAEAFKAYECLVRPYVQSSQNRMNPLLIRLLHPRSRTAIALTHMVQKILASDCVQRRFRLGAVKRERKIGEDFIFPDYR
ncbi:pyridine nucleotide-disulfide oxidoreductase [Gluconacetobacter liquefaciens NRIC 0522]|uniref:2-polyprenyl-6-methoxyphenol hydroxylase-like FAD-dependent oxidoreductase n=1 Tax=Gluconacetobacter liquefaciens TaxID=89584 RepID=A0A370G6A9_GLULI|nr:FAD-dependent monooxygenase [Gluconacetobacter liquefaciens]MBB2185545.1 FAD-binding monooxygenase [Gluconacetobacter liquefaciens]RDI39348.1 2-polyprenyl-6-methoxyphenol hydroxylase-like FAD-dependent oxidoreductase [Gluconacetobacter liquefaciens]GBQ99613.1 pyridine nucleotide-disulfide oxidoreductase [Gluconacetobacter liquefaciens NRIC 0522]